MNKVDPIDEKVVVDVTTPEGKAFLEALESPSEANEELKDLMNRRFYITDTGEVKFEKMRIVFEQESKHEGNDCMIYDYAFVVEVSEGYIANKATIYKGWFGTNTSNQSFVFDNLDEAIEFVRNEPVNVKE